MVGVKHKIHKIDTDYICKGLGLPGVPGKTTDLP
jgi:hypothetical protein